MATSETSHLAKEDQLNFAWRNFEDQQAIIRSADLKAGYLVTFLLFFGASTIPLGKEVFPKLHWSANVEGAVCALYLISYVVLALGFAWSLYFAAVATATPDQLLRNVTDQVFELAQICKSKIDNLRHFSKSFKWTLAAWLISTALGFWIASWR